MKTTLQEYYTILKRVLLPYKDIILFLVLFITLDLVWKLFVDEGADENKFIVLGQDFTASVYPICKWTAEIVYSVIHNIFGYSNYTIQDTIVAFPPPSMKLIIVWGCTGVKQMLIFCLLILIFPGPKKKKWMFIPLSILILNFLNVVRIVATALIVKDGYPEWFIGFNEWYNQTTWQGVQKSHREFYMDWFQFFHKDVFKWLYYDGVMFLLWLWWQEKFNLPFQRKLKEEKQEPISD